MQKIIFATSNAGKIEEAKSILNLNIEGTGFEIDEIQSLDAIEVASKKARAYFEKLEKPLFIEDVSLIFNALGNLPGTYINDFSKSLGNVGLVKLLANKRDRTAIAQTTLVYIDKKTEKVFIGKVKGKISLKPRGEKGFGWDPIFIPDGSDKTFAEMNLDEKNKYSMRRKALLKLKKSLVFLS